MLGLHRMRALLVKFRTMQVNQLRGLLYEFGASFRAGLAAGLAEIRSRTAELEAVLPARSCGAYTISCDESSSCSARSSSLRSRSALRRRRTRRVARSALYLALVD